MHALDSDTRDEDDEYADFSLDQLMQEHDVLLARLAELVEETAGYVPDQVGSRDR